MFLLNSYFNTQFNIKFCFAFLQINNDIASFQEQGVEMESQRKQILKKLEEKQIKASQEADEYETKLKSVNKIIDQLKAGMSYFYFQTVKVI